MCGDSNDGTLAMKKNKKGQRSPVTEVEIAFQISSEKGPSQDNKTTIGISINEKERAKAPRRSPSITSSISSAETSNTQAPSTFNPSRSLFINSQGVRLIRLPVASYELEVNILNPDGSVAYVSRRENRSSGDATLSSPQFGDLLKTCYFFGPHRDPVIRSASNDNTLDTDTNTDTAVKASTPEIKVVGKWNSRTQYFTTFYGDSFQWRYIQCDDPRWNARSSLSWRVWRIIVPTGLADVLPNW
ncbi:hypothetical protein CISG_06959 [Coccidioides immitis RMSCC 3703]|uniref:Uncharacterized protein n=1 Tax=Coccidioides immitis RMSCC 3703 TaxID=454286 RepID=A0A0J8R348_COCIT|nr:hypothetical protein CISG_06959 [Coccidioides immitis RMSCC 3703]